MSNRSREIAVLGLGAFGTAVALELTAIGDRVLGVDKSERAVHRLAGEIHQAVQADAGDEAALRECGLEGIDAVVVAIGADMEASVLATMSALEMGCPDIWVKAINPMHRRIVERLGANHVVQPEQQQGEQLAQLIHNPLIRDYLQLGDGQYIAQLTIPEMLLDADFEHERLEKRFQVQVLGVRRGECLLRGADLPSALSEDDRLILFGERTSIRQLSDTLG